jgi:hypothetical protein
MKLVRSLALLVALLPSAAGAVIYRVDFAVDDLQLSATGDGASFVTLPEDGILRGAHFYDDTPFSSLNLPGSMELEYQLDPDTGGILRIGPDLFIIRNSVFFATLRLDLTDDFLFVDEEDPQLTHYSDTYFVLASQIFVPSPDFTRWALNFGQEVRLDDAMNGAPLPTLMDEVSFTALPDLEVPSDPPRTFAFNMGRSTGTVNVTGVVTDLAVSVSPVPEPDPLHSGVAGATLLAALSRRRNAASIARSISS